MHFKIFHGRARRPLRAPLWSGALDYCRYAQALPHSERVRLQEITQAFLRAKSFEGAVGFEVNEQARVVIALKASVPILNLGIDYYAGWSDIIVYPGDFRVHDEYMDNIGVMHREARELCGQSLQQGPMVLSWQAIAEEQEAADRDVVIHECAHKLDILNGAANGFPPLHRDMSVARWARAFGEAFAALERAVESGKETGLDPYAASDPAEYFAVASETFFTYPAVLASEAPAVYAELATFYRQDPRAILGDGP